MCYLIFCDVTTVFRCTYAVIVETLVPERMYLFATTAEITIIASIQTIMADLKCSANVIVQRL